MVSPLLAQDLLDLIVTLISPAGLQEWHTQQTCKVASASSVSSCKNLATMGTIKTFTNAFTPLHTLVKNYVQSLAG